MIHHALVSGVSAYRYYRIKTKSTLNFTENTLMLNIICTFLCTVFMTTWNNIVQMNTTLKERCPLGSPYTFLTQRTETTASSVITSMTTKSTIFLMFCILSTHFTDDTSSTTMKGKYELPTLQIIPDLPLLICVKRKFTVRLYYIWIRRDYKVSTVQVVLRI